MTNIINFSEYNPFPIVSYLTLVRTILSDEDYQDFLEGCIDSETYNNLDDEMKNIIDAYMAL